MVRLPAIYDILNQRGLPFFFRPGGRPVPAVPGPARREAAPSGSGVERSSKGWRDAEISTRFIDQPTPSQWLIAAFIRQPTRYNIRKPCPGSQGSSLK